MTSELKARPPVVSAAEWQEAHDALLVKEKALTRELDALAAERRRQPMVRFDTPYVFDGPEGKRSLLDLFEGRRQLITYHFMYGPDAEAPCPGCTFFTNNVPVHALALLNDADTSWSHIARAPLPKIEALKAERGWTMPWVSSSGSTFNEDLGLMPGGSDMFGLSCWLRDGDEVFRTYFTDRRGVDGAMFWPQMMDRTAFGRQQEFEDSPEGWPQSPTYG